MENKPIQLKPQDVKYMNGYKLIYIPTYPKLGFSKDNDGWYYEHIYLMEIELSRFMQSDENVHHLDGNRANNRLSNLIVLTGGHHIRLHRWLENNKCFISESIPSPSCKTCGISLQEKQIHTCSIECGLSHRASSICPSKEILAEQLINSSMVKIGKLYGVSDNCIRKWAKKYNLL